MGDFTGKKSKRRQRATMNEMNAMIQKQVEEFDAKQQVAQQQADETRGLYEDFQFTNPYAGAKNIYGSAQNVFAGGQNLYEGMENRFEDMTIDTRAAQFQAEQGRQQRANIMQGLRGAAGTSGVAGLAQALANQGATQAQQISVGISQQERQNQMMAAQEGSRIDQLQRGAGMQLQQMEMQGASEQQKMILGGAAEQQKMILGGAAEVQAAEAGKMSTLLGMDYAMLAGANQAYQGALANQMSGMGMKANMHGAQAQNNMFSTLVNAGAQAAGAYYGAQSDRRLKKNINKIGESPSGLNIYSFEYKDSKYGEGLWQGVMSDEIPQEAVMLMDNGYDAVNYNMLDVEFKQI